MKKHNCETCPFRKRYDRAPKSLLGRIWRWHIDFCPGWREYFKDRTPGKQAELREQYHITNF